MADNINADVNGKVFVISTAQCSVYTASQFSYLAPPLSSNFKTAINELPLDSTDLSPYYKFIDNFGTHSVNSIKMGSRMGYWA